MTKHATFLSKFFLFFFNMCIFCCVLSSEGWMATFCIFNIKISVSSKMKAFQME